jgi:hypothetical protein
LQILPPILRTHGEGFSRSRLTVGKYSIVNRPKFLPQNAKVAPEKSHRPRTFAAEFSADLPKKSRKGAELFCTFFEHKILDTLKKKTIKSTELPDLFFFNVLTFNFANVN